MTSPEGEGVKIDCAGDLRAHPWVVSCTHGKSEAEGGLAMSCADANGRVWMVDSGCSRHQLPKEL